LHLATPENRHEVKQLKKQLDKVQAKIHLFQTDINNKLELQQSHKTTLPLPKLYTRDVQIINKDLLQNVPIAAATTVDGKTEYNLRFLWQKLIKYGEARKFSHNNYKTALGIMINDQTMYEVYETSIKEPLPKLLAALRDIYVSGHTLADYSKDLVDFNRTEKESLMSSIGRLKVLIHKTAVLYRPEQRATRAQITIDAALLKICSPSAREAIMAAKQQAHKYASDISQEELIQIATSAENRNNDAPRTRQHGHINEQVYVAAITAQAPDRSRSITRPITPQQNRCTSNSPEFLKAVDQLRNAREAKRDLSRDKNNPPRVSFNDPRPAETALPTSRSTTPRLTGGNNAYPTNRNRDNQSRDRNRNFGDNRQQDRRRQENDRRNDNRFRSQNRNRENQGNQNWNNRNNQQYRGPNNNMPGSTQQTHTQPAAQVPTQVPIQIVQPAAQPFQMPTAPWIQPAFAQPTPIPTNPQQLMPDYQALVNSYGPPQVPNQDTQPRNFNRNMNRNRDRTQNRDRNNQGPNRNQFQPQNNQNWNRPNRNQGQWQPPQPDRQQQNPGPQNPNQVYKQNYNYNSTKERKPVTANYKPTGTFNQHIQLHNTGYPTPQPPRPNQAPAPVNQQQPPRPPPRQPPPKYNANPNTPNPNQERRPKPTCYACKGTHPHDYKTCQGNSQR
jgi:hypothetical protein